MTSLVQRVTDTFTVEYLQQDETTFHPSRSLAGEWPDSIAIALAKQHHAIAAPVGSCRPLHPTPAAAQRHFGLYPCDD